MGLIMESQGDKKNNGIECEEFVARLFHGRLSQAECYDVETKNFMIEVKSCRAYVRNYGSKSTRSFSFGRFPIIADNHYELIEEAENKNKIACYVFVVRIGKSKIFRKVLCKDVIVKEKNKFIAWRDMIQFKDLGIENLNFKKDYGVKKNDG